MRYGPSRPFDIHPQYPVVHDTHVVMPDFYHNPPHNALQNSPQNAPQNIQNNYPPIDLKQFPPNFIQGVHSPFGTSGSGPSASGFHLESPGYGARSKSGYDHNQNGN